MPRRGKFVDPALRAVRISTISLVWLCGLVAGFFGLLAAAARYGCATADDGLACHTSGSIVGLLIVVAVIAIVIAVTVMSHDRPRRGVVTLGLVGLVALMVCFVAAKSLLATA